MPENKNEPIANKGDNLSDMGQDNIEIKESGFNNLEEVNRIEDKYLDGPDTPGANVPLRHINRNLNKPDIDKPAYS